MPDYAYKFDKFFCIWFSSNEDVGINMENKARLAAIAMENPGIKLSLLYSSNLLSESGKEDLSSFCKEFEITAVDIDKMKIRDEYPKDKQLRALAQRELALWKAGKHGNPAVASDIMRVTTQALQDYSHYFDLDVFIEIPPSMDHYLCGPCIISHKPLIHTDYNNDLILCASDGEKLSKDAIAILEAIQDEIIKRYKKPYKYMVRYLEEQALYAEAEAKLRAAKGIQTSWSDEKKQLLEQIFVVLGYKRHKLEHKARQDEEHKGWGSDPDFKEWSNQREKWNSLPAFKEWIDRCEKWDLDPAFKEWIQQCDQWESLSDFREWNNQREKWDLNPAFKEWIQQCDQWDLDPAFKEWIQQCDQWESLSDFREWTTNNTTKMDQEIRNLLLRSTVVPITGPSVFVAVQGKGAVYLSQSKTLMPAWFRTVTGQGIKNICNNKEDAISTLFPQNFDSSWTTDGAKKQTERDEDILTEVSKHGSSKGNDLNRNLNTMIRYYVRHLLELSGLGRRTSLARGSRSTRGV